MSLAKTNDLEGLAQKIIALKDKYGKSIIKDFLACKWQIGAEISRTRSVRNEAYSQLARLVKLGEDDRAEEG
jgi:hypothetical protein